MDKIALIALIKAEIERLKKLLEGSTYYLDNSQQALGYSFALDDFDEFLDTLSEEPDKVLEGEVILNGHGLLVDVTKWDNGYKLKVIIKED